MTVEDGLPALVEQGASVLPFGRPKSGFGVDRLSVSFPLADAPDEDSFIGGTATFDVGDGGPADAGGIRYGIRHQLGEHHSVFVGASLLATKDEHGVLRPRWFGKVETNPARFADPDGCGLLDPAGLEAAADRMFEVAAEYVDIKGSPADASVKRLDVARDFRQVSDVSAFVRSLRPIHRPYAKRCFTYHNPQRNNAETLAVGSGAGMVRLYDQHAAYADKGAERGSLRWEVEGRGGWLARDGQVVRVRDLSEDRVMGFASARWEWSRMGAAVESTVNVVEAVEALICRHKRGARGVRLCACDGITRAQADRLLGQLVREAHGMGAAAARGTDAKYRGLKRELGTVVHASAGTYSQTVLRTAARLDWQSGTEVAA